MRKLFNTTTILIAATIGYVSSRIIYVITRRHYLNR